MEEIIRLYISGGQRLSVLTTFERNPLTAKRHAPLLMKSINHKGHKGKNTKFSKMKSINRRGRREKKRRGLRVRYF